MKTDWRRHVLASSGYLELGMFDDAAMVLEEIAPEDKTHNEVPGARVNLYMATKKWEMAASVAKSSGEGRARRSRLMDQFAYATRRAAEVHIEEDSRRYSIV